MTTLITDQLVSLDANLGATSQDVITALARRVVDAGRATSAEGLVADALAREAQSATGLPGGIAIPHCRSTSVTEPTLAFARLSPMADFGAPDGPADLVFMIAAPDGAGEAHLTLLSALARSLVRADFTDALRAASTPADVVALVEQAVTPPAAEPAPAETGSAASAPHHVAAPRTTLVAVTACPTGIAHTYMAADSLAQAAERAGVELVVETQGSAGSTKLDPAVIAAADAVIFATDVGVKDRARFAGKPVVTSGVKRAINESDAMITEAVAAASDPSAARVDGTAPQGGSAGHAPATSGFGLRLRQWLLTGVSYMIPFVAAGGLLIALGFLLGGYEVALNGDDGVQIAQSIFANNSLGDLPAATEHALFGSGLLTYLGALIFLLGGWAFGFLVPALSGYIAYAMADRPGIAPGFVMGFVANQIGGGFIGGIIGGLLAGALASFFTGRGYPRWLQGLMPVVVIPLITTLVIGLVMLLLLAKPLSWTNESLSDGLNSLSGSSAILLGAILGLMMAFDLGGPVNKAAYVFAVTGLSAAGALDPGSSQGKIMAAVMIAGMTPPLALALSAALRPRLYTEEERENGRAAWLLGASFISEGAIPFAAADPLRVIPSMMLGSATAGALSMASGVTLVAPHGGIFVFFAVDNVLMFFVSIVVGTVISALAVTATKQARKVPVTETAAEPVAA